MPDTATAEVTFWSKVHNQRLVRTPKRREGIEPGEATEGSRYEFKDHQLQTDDPDLIAWLRGHHAFNQDFWEFGNAPDETLPKLEDLMGDIARAAADRDQDRLVELWEAEDGTHKREPALAAIRAALEQIVGPEEPPEAA